MILALWITAVSGAVTAVATAAASFQHRRQDKRRFADVHKRIDDSD